MYTAKLKENLGSIPKSLPLNKKSFICPFITVTIFLTVIFVGSVDGSYQIEFVEAIVSQSTNSASVSELMQRGNTLFNISKYEEAIIWYDKALMIDPKFFDALNGKGQVFNKLGRYEEAITWFDKAIDIDPKDIDALNNKGVTLANLGRYEEAITWFDKAIDIDPNSADALYNKGGALGELGKYEEAIVWTDKALAIDPNNQNASNPTDPILPNTRK